MGVASKFVNAWACIWTLLVSIIFILPTVYPVDADNMNYAIVYLVAILVFSMIWWAVGGRKYYTGPLIEAETLESDSLNTESSERKEEIIDAQLQHQRAIPVGKHAELPGYSEAVAYRGRGRAD